MHAKLSIFGIMSLLLFSCNTAKLKEEQNEQKKISKWIVGKYLFMDEGAGVYYEEWTKNDSVNYNGNGFYLTGDAVDTLFSMHMKLILQKDKTVLIYDVKESGKMKELEFFLTSKENSNYVFENPVHDFPSILQYKFLPDSTIEVTQRGFIENKEKVRDYKIRKINQ